MVPHFFSDKLDDYVGIRKEGEQLIRDYEGKVNLDELDKTDPTLSRFVRLGQWAFDALTKMGHIKGKLLDDMFLQPSVIRLTVVTIERTFRQKIRMVNYSN